MSPIRAPIKSAPFPWNISKHFDGSGFPPAGSLESVTPSTPPAPTTHTPITTATLSTDLTSYASQRQAVLSERWRELRRGSPTRSHFLRGAPGTRMGRGCIVGCWKSLTWIPQVGSCCTAVTSGRLGSGIFWNAKRALGLCDLRLASEKVI